MHKEYYNILVAGFDPSAQASLLKLLTNCQSINPNVQLDIHTSSNYDKTITALSDSFYKVCLLNSELKTQINHKIIYEIQNKLSVQNKNTAIINLKINTNRNTKNQAEDNSFSIQKFNNFCINEVEIDQLNEYWLLFIIKTAVDKLHLQKELKRLSHYDNLTGLVNRNLYLNHLNHAMAMAEREKRFCTLIYLDINNFRLINERFGSKIGDDILIECAQRIKKSIRSVDIAARLGSDEFAILLENCHPFEAKRTIEDLKKAMLLPFNIYDEKTHIAFSIDNASYPDECSDKSSFLNNVRQAHYLAKTE